MGTGGIVPTKFWQNFQLSLRSFIWPKRFPQFLIKFKSLSPPNFKTFRCHCTKKKKKRIKKNVKANVISRDHVSLKNYLCHLINLNVSHFTIITFSPFFLPPSPLIMPQWDWKLYGGAFKFHSLDATSKWLWSHCSCRQPAIPKKSCNVQLLHECVTL